VVARFVARPEIYIREIFEQEASGVGNGPVAD